MKALMLERGLSEPEYDEYSSTFAVTLYKTKEEIYKKTVEKTVEKILQLIDHNPQITQNQLAEKTGLTRRGVEWNLKKLKKEKIIERIGPAKGGYWKVTGSRR